MPDDVEILVVALPRGAAAPPAFTGLRADLVVADLAVVPQPAPLAAQVAAARACFVDGLEVHATRAAIDFHALVDAEADPDMLRDALDEFLAD